MNSPQTPPTSRGARRPARRRVHRRTHTVLFLTICIALWLYVGGVVVHLWHNPIMIPTWFILGAATVPVTLFWVMIHRLRTTDTVSVLNLVLAAVIGGSLAVVLGGSLDSLVGFVPQENDLLSLSVAGLVEEFAKGVLIVAVGWRVAKTARNGLFVGGAVGLGFAVLETIGYIDAAFVGEHPIVAASGTVVVRGLTAPFGHVLWSSLLGAALFAAAARTGRFRLSWSVLGAYLGVAVLHGLWDGSAKLASTVSTNEVVRGVGIGVGIVVPIVVGGLIWRHVARRAAAPVERSAPVERAALVPAEVPADAGAEVRADAGADAGAEVQADAGADVRTDPGADSADRDDALIAR